MTTNHPVPNHKGSVHHTERGSGMTTTKKMTDKQAQAEARHFANRSINRLRRKGNGGGSWIGAYMVRYRQLTGRPLVAGPVPARRRRRAA